MTLNLDIENPARVLLARVQRKVRMLCKRTWHRLLRISGKKSRAVFLVGSGRSGTDILVHCLNRSASVLLINEDNDLAFSNWRLKSLDTVVGVVEASGAPVVLVKPIVETMRVVELLDAFPDSLALFIIRHYHDAINSMARFFGEAHVRTVDAWVMSGFEKQRLVPEQQRREFGEIWQVDRSIETACGIYWLVYNSSYLTLGLKEDPRVKLVAYEDIVSEPSGTLKDICRFLGLSFSASMTRDIYSRSVKRGSPPVLNAGIESMCREVWDSLKAVQMTAANPQSGNQSR